ncbi:daunorubicin C-13 ketoreductase [Haloprofundus marisrubri]|uniref:Daunorubicin C-13 ketoreductase n=1 Tax=Haloprofundus marisrubri TaxID=1514971 RepID=A0A0W1RDN3_9EURY|nr:SDR family NAD(P)-dependent oxidoreductase [Haloprofundus marisrubri]KTG11551.1 daunorubicin C-13 ketoreductase [Haloprofundus marisrubri]
MTETPESRAGVTDVDLSGTTALVTGSTSGIGREAALSLGRLGADVLVHGRDETAGNEVVDELVDAGSDARFVEADFASIEDVNALAETVRTETSELDVLLNNAGGLFRTGRLTDAGVEYTFHVNHLAPYLLTTNLLGHLAPDARVVTTASEAHRGAQPNWDAVTSVDDYSTFGAYSRSKLANIQFSIELAHRLDAADDEITSNALHPGAIPGSGFARFLPGPIPRAMQLLDGLPFVTSVDDGAAALVNLAASDRLEGVSGRYFDQQQIRTPSSAALDPDSQHDLWTRSAEFLDIDVPLSEASTQG